MIKELTPKDMFNIFILKCNDLSNNEKIRSAQLTIMVHFVYEIEERRLENVIYFNYEYRKILMSIDEKWNDLSELLEDYYGRHIMLKNGFRHILKDNHPMMYQYYLAYCQ